MARVSAATAAESPVDGDPVTVTTDDGSVTLPLAVTEMPDGRRVAPGQLGGIDDQHQPLGVGPGDHVRISAGGAR